MGKVECCFVTCRECKSQATVALHRPTAMQPAQQAMQPRCTPQGLQVATFQIAAWQSGQPAHIPRLMPISTVPSCEATLARQTDFSP